MAKIYWQLAGGGTLLRVYQDPEEAEQADVSGRLLIMQEIRGLSDGTRTLWAQVGVPQIGIGVFPSLQDFDDLLDTEIDRLSDILDYYDYDARDETLVVRDGAWFTPVAVESVTDENSGEEAVKAIDGDFTQWWQSDAAGERKIVFRIRDYNKRLTGLRLRTTAGDERTWLRAATISVSGAIGAIDDPDRIASSNVDFDYDGDAWMEHTLASPMTGKYLQIAVSTSAFSNSDQVRIREIEVRVGTLGHDKVIV